MAHTLFIGGLANSTSNERLRELFAAAGGVESAAVVMDRDTRRVARSAAWQRDARRGP